jgi:hypothetical protein
LLIEVGCHYFRLAAAALGQFGEVARSVQQELLQGRVAEVAVAVYRYHLLENHPEFHEYCPPSEI